MALELGWFCWIRTSSDDDGDDDADGDDDGGDDDDGDDDDDDGLGVGLILLDPYLRP